MARSRQFVKAVLAMSKKAKKEETPTAAPDDEQNKKKKLTIKQKLELQAARWKTKKYSKKKIPMSFFNKPTVEASKLLLGKILSINGKQAFITETEAYTGKEDDDGAAHAFNRDPADQKVKRKKKTTAALSNDEQQQQQQQQQTEEDHRFIAYHTPGKIYVYQIYGMHFCMNLIVEPEDRPGCVLIRAVRDVEDGTLIDGPGRVCKYFNEMTKKSHNGVVLQQHGDDNKEDHMNHCSVREGVKLDLEKDMKATKRIGITKAVDFPWRFLIKEEEENE